MIDFFLFVFINPFNRGYEGVDRGRGFENHVLCNANPESRHDSKVVQSLRNVRAEETTKKENYLNAKIVCEIRNGYRECAPRVPTTLKRVTGGNRTMAYDRNEGD